MAIVIHKYPRPILEVSLESGGDLPQGQTYYFTGFFQKYAGYFGSAASPAAAEVFITTTAANQKIRLRWKYDDGQGGFTYGIPTLAGGFVYRWDTYSILDGQGKFYPWRNLNNPGGGDDTYGHRRWGTRYSIEGIYGSEIYITTANLFDGGAGDSASYCSWGIGHPEIAWNLEYDPIDSRFSREHGKLGIDIQDSGHDWDGVIQALEDASIPEIYVIGKSYLILLGTIMGAGEIEIERKLIIFHLGFNQNVNVTFRNCIILTEHNKGWNNIRGSFINTRSLHGDHGTKFQGPGYSPLISNLSLNNISPTATISTYQSIRGLVIEDQSFELRYPKSTMDFADLKFINAELLISYRYDQDIYLENVYFENVLGTMFAHDIRNDMIFPPQVAQKLVCKNASCDRQDGILVVKYKENARSAFLSYEFWFTLTITVSDVDGLLEGAKVQLLDTELAKYSGESDENGSFSDDLLSYLVTYDPDDSPNYAAYNLKGPFQLLITKSGYVDYQAEHEITDTLDLQIALQKNDLFITEALPVSIIDDSLLADIQEDLLEVSIED